MSNEWQPSRLLHTYHLMKNCSKLLNSFSYEMLCGSQAYFLLKNSPIAEAMTTRLGNFEKYFPITPRTLQLQQLVAVDA